MRFVKFLILILIIAGVGYVLYNRLMPGAPAGGMPPGMGGAMPVSVAEVVEREVQIWNEFSGRLVAVDRAEVRARVAGPIVTIHFQDGAYVEKETPLFTIDQAPYLAAVNQAKGVLASAQARVTLANAEFERSRKLFETRAISERDFDQRRNDRNVAVADQKSAEAALELAQLSLDYSVVRAPISGRVSRAEVTVGNLVDAGNPVLTTVVADRPIYADFEMDESTYLQYARSGGQDLSAIPVMVGLASETDAPHEGRVASFDNQLNVASGTIRVRAILENKDGALVPGLFARVRIGGPVKEKALLINQRAVGTDQDKKFVMAVGPNNVVEYRPVKLGQMADGLRIVTSGLQSGDVIIVNGLQRARPGAPVIPEPVPMDNPDAPTASSQAAAAAAAQAQGQGEAATEAQPDQASE